MCMCMYSKRCPIQCTLKQNYTGLPQLYFQNATYNILKIKMGTRISATVHKSMERYRIAVNFRGRKLSWIRRK